VKGKWVCSACKKVAGSRLDNNTCRKSYQHSATILVSKLLLIAILKFRSTTNSDGNTDTNITD